MNIEDIKTIMKLMAEYQLTEFSVEAEGSNISIKREAAAPAQIAGPVVMQQLPAAAVPAPAAAVEAAPAAAPAPGAAGKTGSAGSKPSKR